MSYPTFRPLVDKRATVCCVTNETAASYVVGGTDYTMCLLEAPDGIYGSNCVVVTDQVAGAYVEENVKPPVAPNGFYVEYDVGRLTFDSDKANCQICATYGKLGSVVWAQDVLDAYAASNYLCLTAMSTAGGTMTGNLVMDAAARAMVDKLQNIIEYSNNPAMQQFAQEKLPYWADKVPTAAGIGPAPESLGADPRYAAIKTAWDEAMQTYFAANKQIPGKLSREVLTKYLQTEPTQKER